MFPHKSHNIGVVEIFLFRKFTSGRFINEFLAVNGVLLKDNTHEKEVYISDCIPLFHQVRILTVNRIQYLLCNCISLSKLNLNISGFDLETNVTDSPSYNR